MSPAAERPRSALRLLVVGAPGLVLEEAGAHAADAVALEEVDPQLVALARHHPPVLLEEHVVGEDHRAHHGGLLLRREPGGVIVVDVEVVGYDLKSAFVTMQ